MDRLRMEKAWLAIVCVYTQARTYTIVDVHVHIDIDVHKDTNTHTQTHRHIHTNTHPYIHTHTLTYTYAYTCPCTSTYKVLSLSRLVLQKVVGMWRAAGHFDVSACLTTHVMIADLYFCWRACGVLMFWRASRLPHEFFAGLDWGLAGTRAVLALTRAALTLIHRSCAAIDFDVLQICMPACTVIFPIGSYTF